MKIDIATIVAKIAEDSANKIKRVLSYTEVVNDLMAAGVDIDISACDIRLCLPITIKRADLAKVRGIVGRLQVQYKSPASDFNDTNNLVVTIRPINKKYDFAFMYKVKYRKGGKCKVVNTVMPAYSNLTMVCEK